MFKSILSLLAIIFVVLLLGTVGVLTLRKLGQEQQFAPLDHTLLNGGPWTIAFGGDPSQGPAFSKQAFQAAAALSPSMILGATVQQLSDETLVVYPTHYLTGGTDLQYLVRMNLEQFRTAAPDAPTLEEFLGIAKGHPIYLNVDRLIQAFVAKVAEEVSKSFADDQVLIASSSQPVKKYMKERKPLWLYGATAAEMGKLQLIGALYLEPILSIDADFVEADALPEHIREELRRRNIRLVFSKRTSPEQSLLATQPGQLSGLVEPMEKTN